MIETALQSIETGGLSSADRDSAIGEIALYVEEHTRTISHLPQNSMTTRVVAAIVKTLNTDERDLPLSQLMWILGRVNDPGLEANYKRWLLRYVTRLKHYNAAMHQTLVNLDRLTENWRSADRLEVEENIRRADDYLDEQVGW